MNQRRFWPTIRPLFHAGRSARMAGKFGVSMTDPPIRHTLHNDNPTLTGHHITRLLHCLGGLQ